jgi:hypothetical protein
MMVELRLRLTMEYITSDMLTNPRTNQFAVSALSDRLEGRAASVSIDLVIDLEVLAPF